MRDFNKFTIALNGFSVKSDTTSITSNPSSTDNPSQTPEQIEAKRIREEKREEAKQGAIDFLKEIEKNTIICKKGGLDVETKAWLKKLYEETPFKYSNNVIKKICNRFILSEEFLKQVPIKPIYLTLPDPEWKKIFKILKELHKVDFPDIETDIAVNILIEFVIHPKELISDTDLDLFISRADSENVVRYLAKHIIPLHVFSIENVESYRKKYNIISSLEVTLHELEDQTIERLSELIHFDLEGKNTFVSGILKYDSNYLKNMMFFFSDRPEIEKNVKEIKHKLDPLLIILEKNLKNIEDNNKETYLSLFKLDKDTYHNNVLKKSEFLLSYSSEKNNYQKGADHKRIEELKKQIRSLCACLKIIRIENKYIKNHWLEHYKSNLAKKPYYDCNKVKNYELSNKILGIPLSELIELQEIAQGEDFNKLVRAGIFSKSDIYSFRNPQEVKNKMNEIHVRINTKGVAQFLEDKVITASDVINIERNIFERAIARLHNRDVIILLKTGLLKKSQLIELDKNSLEELLEKINYRLLNNEIITIEENKVILKDERNKDHKFNLPKDLLFIFSSDSQKDFDRVLNRFSNSKTQELLSKKLLLAKDFINTDDVLYEELIEKIKNRLNNGAKNFFDFYSVNSEYAKHLIRNTTDEAFEKVIKLTGNESVQKLIEWELISFRDIENLNDEAFQIFTNRISSKRILTCLESQYFNIEYLIESQNDELIIALERFNDERVKQHFGNDYLDVSFVRDANDDKFEIVINRFSNKEVQKHLSNHYINSEFVRDASDDKFETVIKRFSNKEVKGYLSKSYIDPEFVQDSSDDTFETVIKRFLNKEVKEYLSKSYIDLDFVQDSNDDKFEKVIKRFLNKEVQKFCDSNYINSDFVQKSNDDKFEEVIERLSRPCVRELFKKFNRKSEDPFISLYKTHDSIDCSEFLKTGFDNNFEELLKYDCSNHEITYQLPGLGGNNTEKQMNNCCHIS